MGLGPGGTCSSSSRCPRGGSTHRPLSQVFIPHLGWGAPLPPPPCKLGMGGGPGSECPCAHSGGGASGDRGSRPRLGPGTQSRGEMCLPARRGRCGVQAELPAAHRGLWVSGPHSAERHRGCRRGQTGTETFETRVHSTHQQAPTRGGTTPLRRTEQGARRSSWRHCKTSSDLQRAF